MTTRLLPPSFDDIHSLKVLLLEKDLRLNEKDRCLSEKDKRISLLEEQ
jgi:hypothetical protein